MSSELEKAKARQEIVDSVRDLYTAKITLPLGNPNLKLVHTNQMLFTQLSEQEFELANFAEIAKKLNSTYSRFGGYVLNRWYIESVTITNKGNSGTMELTINPFPSNLLNFKDDRDSFISEYNDAISSTTNTSGKKTVKSVSSNLNLKNVKGLSKSDQEYVKKIVKKALKAANNPKSNFKKAKAVFEYYRDNHVYSGYECMKHFYQQKKGFEKTWKIKGHNCGDGAAILQALFRCLGFTADIYNGHHHFWIRVKIDGKYYYCDQAGSPGKSNTRVLGAAGNNNNVWKGISGGSKRNAYC